MASITSYKITEKYVKNFTIKKSPNPPVPDVILSDGFIHGSVQSVSMIIKRKGHAAHREYRSTCSTFKPLYYKRNNMIGFLGEKIFPQISVQNILI